MKQLDKAISHYVDIRADISARKKEFDAWESDQKSKLAKLEMYIQAALEEMHLEKAQANGYTASKTFKDSVTIEDKVTFTVFLVQKLLLHLQPHMYRKRDGDWLDDGMECLREQVEAVMQSGAFDLLSMSANKTNCKAYMDSNAGSMPTGVKYTKIDAIQIRKIPAKKGVKT